MKTIEQISKHMNLGDPSNREVNNRSEKLTADLAGQFRPTEGEIYDCQLLASGEMGDAPLCQIVESIQLKKLPKVVNGKRPSRDHADIARRAACLIRRACPAVNHQSKKTKLFFAVQM